ncbi:MAG: lipoate protein ligase C-terminal domain-containing protein [Candidatus Bathyarchaeia archaeon]
MNGLKAEYKVPQGKLIRVNYMLNNSKKILNIKITGDFFLHPEESIEELENNLKGLKVDELELEKAIQDFFKKGHILIGAEPKDFVIAILKALKVE